MNSLHSPLILSNSHLQSAHKRRECQIERSWNAKQRIYDTFFNASKYMNACERISRRLSDYIRSGISCAREKESERKRERE